MQFLGGDINPNQTETHPGGELSDDLEPGDGIQLTSGKLEVRGRKNLF